MLPTLLVGLVIGVAVVVVLARRGAGKVQSRVDELVAALGPVERQGRASSFGLASAGTTQVRGLGLLALTADELVFFQFVPDQEIRVRRSDIAEVGTARSYLGKTQGRDLLVVTWAADEAAWDVDDVEGWRAALTATR